MASRARSRNCSKSSVKNICFESNAKHLYLCGLGFALTSPRKQARLRGICWLERCTRHDSQHSDSDREGEVERTQLRQHESMPRDVQAHHAQGVQHPHWEGNFNLAIQQARPRDPTTSTCRHKTTTTSNTRSKWRRGTSSTSTGLATEEEP